MQNRVEVKVNSKLVGKLLKEKNEFIYSYDTQDKSDFISLTMQVRAKEFLSYHLHPIFEMHLPEGYLLSIIKKHFSKIAKTDDFGLLKLMSKNVHGRVNYEQKSTENTNFLNLEDILKPKSDKLFDELVSKFALNSVLSGVQPKVLATLEDKATLQLQDYIVKSWGDEYPQLALNEYYCMKIARYSGVIVPEFYISADDRLFVMKRFDILDDGTKLGFEDMCVLQIKQRDDKYEGTNEQIVKTIKTFVSSKNKKSSLKQFFKILVINNLVKNGDAHLKNFGLIYEDIDNIRLAPAYDIVCTTLYIKNDIPALHMLGSKKWWDKKYMIRFGIEVCEFSNKDANIFYDECLVGLEKVTFEIKKRLKDERNQEKIRVLKGLIEVFSN